VPTCSAKFVGGDPRFVPLFLLQCIVNSWPDREPILATGAGRLSRKTSSSVRCGCYGDAMNPRRPSNTGLKLAAPSVRGGHPFVNVKASRRSLGAIR